ncbi:MAG: methylamine utilization protein [Rhodoferax sp.]|nr:methylamine utilization protein [Rhodoferax sp.]
MKFTLHPLPAGVRAFASFVALVAAPAFAATVQVQVQDGAGRALPDAVVLLESREARLLVKPAQGTEMAQINKQFEPRVLVVPVGTAVFFPNRDTVRHHVYSFSPAKTFELKLYAGIATNPVVFDKTGIAVLGCNIHDSMTAWVVVVDTPYYGRSPKSGLVALGQVPAGTYRLRVWHPGLAVGAPATDQELVVGSADSLTTYRLPGVSP